MGLLLVLTGVCKADINGAAIYEHYGKEQFLAVLHLPVLTTDANQVLQQSRQATMEYVVVAQDVSSRRLARHWLESVVINADRQQVEANSEALAALTELIQGPLLEGDTLRLTSVGDGVAVTLNDIALGNIVSSDLLSLLLQTWVGSVPPSSTFRSGILSGGDIFVGLLGRYRSATPVEGRGQQIEQEWFAAPGEEGGSDAGLALAAQADPVTTNGAVTGVQSEVPLAAAAAPVGAANSSVNPTASQPANNNASYSPAVAAVQVQDTPAVQEATEVVSEAIVEAATTPLPQLAMASGTSEAQVIEEARLASLPAASQEPEAISVDAVLVNKTYYDDIKRKIYQQVSYPEIGLRNGRESQVALNVLIDQAGELVDVEVSDKSRYKYFNKAAVRAVETASPFGPPPELLTDNGLYQFKMQVNFRLTPAS